MFMRGLFLAAVAAAGIAAPGAVAEEINSGAGMPVLRTASDHVSFWLDGRKNADVWGLDPSVNAGKARVKVCIAKLRHVCGSPAAIMRLSRQNRDIYFSPFAPY